MGLKMKIGRENNQKAGEFLNGYYNIASVRQEDTKVYITVRGYVDETARRFPSNQSMPGPMGDINQKYVVEKQFTVMQSELPTPTVTGNVVNMLKNAAYLWLKQQSEFSTAEDCL